MRKINMTNEAIKHIHYLINMSNDFLGNKIDIDEFCIEFENYLDDYETEICNFNNEIYQYLDCIKMGVVNYESIPEARDRPYFLDEDGVRKRTKSVLDVLANKYNLR